MKQNDNQVVIKPWKNSCEKVYFLVNLLTGVRPYFKRTHFIEYSGCLFQQVCDFSQCRDKVEKSGGKKNLYSKI